ncbi:MAG: hypothetical protein IKZ88_05485, partial [Neisseriaceae bacterium]|nr:hypothetical protein [Neisseriaceae bacterium]
VGNLLPTVTAEYILTSLRSPHFVSGSLNDKNQRLRRCWWVETAFGVSQNNLQRHLRCRWWARMPTLRQIYFFYKKHKINSYKNGQKWYFCSILKHCIFY